MRINLFCSKSLADGHSFETESKGVFCRTVHGWELPKFLENGWVKNAEEVQPEKAKRQAKKETEQKDLLGE